MIFHNIVWDFNGTLLDDVDAAIAAVNDGFAKRGIRLTSRGEYRRNMDMPIEKYYEKHVNLARVTFAELSADYLAGYEKHFGLIRLSEGALETAVALKKAGAKQFIISSFEQQRLRALAESFGIAVYMDGIFGAEDTKCRSKTQRGASWIKEQGISARDVLVVGDLVHDLDMARAMGCACLLYSGGHQCAEALAASGAPVINKLSEVLSWVKV